MRRTLAKPNRPESRMASTPDSRALADLLSHEGGAFVNVAYERLLGRQPADAEREPWLSALRSGSRSKLDVLAGIRNSPEGRNRDVAIPGLAAPIESGWVRRLPIIGPLTQWIKRLATLHRLGRRIDLLEAASIGGLVGQMREVDALRGTLIEELRRIDEVKAERSLVEARLRALWTWVTPAGMPATGTGPEALPKFDAVIARARFSDFYRRFEDRFRGAPEEIRERLSFYVPMLGAAAQALPSDPPARFVDLGCGRGELLQLLREQGLAAYGVDNSDEMIAHCRRNGHEVIHGDVVEHLASLPSDSLAGVTSIHVIEHLPFLHLQALFEQCFRALRPGGVAVFETPNPENLIVGACNFYYDPTHLRPLPPEPMRFLLEASGFVRVVIERLHPGITPAQVDAATDAVSKIYSPIMMVPQDYALIGYKPAASDALPHAMR